jgi:excinuclease ABC subunit C
VFQTRNLIKDGSQYFGPYPSLKMMHTLLGLIKQLYPLRTCNLNLAPENIKKEKFKVCLQYHIGNCKGPCENLQSEEDYNTNIALIQDIIKGNISSVIRQLKTLMNEYADTLDFEKAQIVKEKIETLENYQSKSTVVNADIDNVDVFSIISTEESSFVNFLKVIKGAIIQSYTLEVKKKLDESDAEILSIAIAEILERYDSNTKEIIVPTEPDLLIPGKKYTIPQKGDKKHLLELSERNAKYFRLDKQKQKDLVDPERHSKRIMNQMMQDLRMNILPLHIECFDNSNIQGAFPVAAMVVFKNGKPSKSEYRHFNIKSVEGPNDFASMEEVLYRRYKRLLEENKELPQLIVVDGGKGQLSSALKSLEKLGLRGKIGIIGIAKRLEEIYYPEDSLPMYLDKKSETLKVIQYMRDEAHRFGITHHRSRRSKETIKSELSEIEGIGPKTVELLLNKFRSVEKIKIAGHDEITAVAGKSKGEIVYDFFHKKS